MNLGSHSGGVSPRTLLRTHAATLLSLLGVVAVALGLWAYAGSHQVLPGLRGCGLVRDTAARSQCYTHEFRHLVAQRGVAGALREVDRQAANAPALARGCHLAWHPVGEAAGARAAAAHAQPSPPHDTSACSQGYAHGYLIGYLDATSLDATTGARVSAICRARHGATDQLTCAHAAGHAFLRAARASDPVAATRQCLQLDLGSATWKQGVSLHARGSFECTYGLFMEQTMRDPASAQAHNPCSALAEPAAQLGCYAFLPARLARAGVSLATIARGCTGAPNVAARSLCIDTLSRQGIDRPCSALSGADAQLCNALVHDRTSSDAVTARALRASAG